MAFIEAIVLGGMAGAVVASGKPRLVTNWGGGGEGNPAR